MDFTREPIIETIITPRDGCKLVIRSSKGAGQEEHFVDAVEVVSFGSAIFFRSLERPKSFLVPVSDFEVVEVRETRMVLKSATPEKSIKIGGGRDTSSKPSREMEKEEVRIVSDESSTIDSEDAGAVPGETAEAKDLRLDKKRDRRRHHRKKRGGKDEVAADGTTQIIPAPALEEGQILIPAPSDQDEKTDISQIPLSPSVLSSLLQPPPTLISESISRYRENALFKNAFFVSEEELYKPHDKVQDLLNEEEFTPPLPEPTYENESEQSTSTEPVSEFVSEEQPNISNEIVENVEKPEKKERVKKVVAPVEAEPSLPLFAEDLNGSLGDEELFPNPTREIIERNDT